MESAMTSSPAKLKASDVTLPNLVKPDPGHSGNDVGDSAGDISATVAASASSPNNANAAERTASTPSSQSWISN
jgi:hypothetical protein